MRWLGKILDFLFRRKKKLPYFCARCGYGKVANIGDTCCRPFMPLDEYRCGICGKRSTMFFVHGFRCKDHEFQIEPSDAIIGDKMIVVIPRVHTEDDQCTPGKE